MFSETNNAEATHESNDMFFQLATSTRQIDLVFGKIAFSELFLTNVNVALMLVEGFFRFAKI
jgi:hypothetical protein